MVFLRCDGREALKPLLEATAPGIGYAEDWTHSVRHYCLRCSFGTPHRHAPSDEGTWQPDRNLGVAAQSRKSVEALLDDWSAGAPGRHVHGIEIRELAIPARVDGHVWWEGPAGDETSDIENTPDAEPAGAAGPR